MAKTLVVSRHGKCAILEAEWRVTRWDCWASKGRDKLELKILFPMDIITCAAVIYVAVTYAIIWASGKIENGGLGIWFPLQALTDIAI